MKINPETEKQNRKFRILIKAGLFVEPEFVYRGVVFNRKTKKNALNS
jgi:hypothetical protein